MKKIGFLINPIAGMGGTVGLKGTDGVVERAMQLGAQPTAHLKAGETLAALRHQLAGTPGPPAIAWLTCSGKMGADALHAAGFDDVEAVHAPAEPPTAKDTTAAIRRFVDAGVDLILFCGGDGTARDICSVAGTRVPILGIPAGVKMYSGVFGVSATRTADIVTGYLAGRLGTAEADVLDLDEVRYREGEWAVRLYHAALTPYEPTYTQSQKMLIDEATDADVKQEIAQHLLEEIEANPEILFLLGPGSTVQSIGTLLEVDKTLLGIDAVLGGQIVGSDLNERGLLDLIERHPRRRLVLSPIGAQGFVLGRGNRPLTPEIIRAIGADNITVVATPAKLERTPLLRFDTGDAALDAALAGDGFLPVVIGYRLRRLVRVAV
ncbi:MAG: ATP-NAD kinase family protein [Rhodospirillales bacterium]|nr:MAG: ATP-NAD kinase family protein [Rhodospirillales bacterium]